MEEQLHVPALQAGLKHHEEGKRCFFWIIYQCQDERIIHALQYMSGAEKAGLEELLREGCSRSSYYYLD